MITNFFNFNVNNKNVKLREISFFEFKNICKKTFSDDIDDLNYIFEEIFNETVLSEKLNCIEKLYCLLLLRNLIHGTDFVFVYEGKKITLNLNNILQNLIFSIKDIVIDSGDSTFYFNLPQNFYNKTIDSFIADCLIKIKQDDREIDCTSFTHTEKKILLNELSLPIFETHKKLQAEFDRNLIEFYKDIKVNIYDGSMLYFLKRLYYDDMSSLYTFEYTCIKNLNLGAIDMEKYTYAELKIFLQNLTKEAKEKQQTTMQPQVEL